MSRAWIIEGYVTHYMPPYRDEWVPVRVMPTATQEEVGFPVFNYQQPSRLNLQQALFFAGFYARWPQYDNDYMIWRVRNTTTGESIPVSEL